MKKAKILSLVLAVTMLFTLLAACGNGTSSGNQTPAPESSAPVETQPIETTPASDTFDLKVCIASEPQTIDPALNSAVDGAVMTQHIFEGLMKWSNAGSKSDDKLYAAEVVPGQAASYEKTDNGDGTVTYTFKIRSDAKWSDGQPVTANDFVYSWRRLVDPNTASPYNTIIAMVVNANEIIAGELPKEELGVRAVDDHTFQVDLTYNCPYFLDICAFPNTMPLREDIVEGNTTWTQDPSTYVTNGPFKMESWTHDAEIVMVPNENYYDMSSVSIERLTFALMDDANAQLTAFRNGDLDFVQNPPPDEVASLLADGTLIAGDYLGTYYACFNNSKAPFDDVNVRKAFNLAIDRNYIVEMVTQAGEIPAGAWVPESVVDAEGTDGPDFREVGGDFWSTAEEDYEANCEQARELLAQAGYPNGEGFPETTYLYNTDDKHQAVAEALQQMWSNVLGVDVTLNNQDWNVFLETRSAGDYSICRNGWIADYNDPVSFLDMFMTDNGNNDAHYSNPEYDAMMTTVLSDSDAAGRMELMHQAETLLCDTDCAIAPLYYYSQPYMVSDRVHGMYYTPLGNFIFTYATVE